MSARTSAVPAKAEFLTRQHTAEWLSVSVQTIDKLIRDEVLHAYRVGRCVRLRKAEVLAYVEGGRA